MITFVGNFSKAGSNLQTEFNVFAAKRPVDRPTTQIRAQQAFDRIKHLLTDEERTKLNIAWSHAIDVGEGRGEHDRICKEIRARLWND